MVKQQQSHLSSRLVPKGRTLYFNEELHKYTDDLETNYTSTTTVIGKYHEKFDSKSIAEACEKIGKNRTHPKYLKYKNKTAKQLIYEWELETLRACDKGSAKHSYLETTIKAANGYNLNAKGFIEDKIYTIDDVIVGHNFGKLSLKFFTNSGIDVKYPTIFHFIKNLVEQGFNIYAEIGVYDYGLKVSGLIDILFIRGTEFIILDWKTNKAPIKFEAGYFDKSSDGKLLLDKFISKDTFMYYPINYLEDSIGNHYTLQLSIYDYLVESFGLTCLGNILCHIRTIESDTLSFDENGKQIEKEEVTMIPIKYLKEDVEKLLCHHLSTVTPAKNLFN